MKTRRSIWRLAVPAAIAVVLLWAPDAGAELLQLFGTVTIDNQFDKPAIIYVEKVAPWGKREWKQIGQVPPKSAGTFAGIREGTMMGASIVDVGPQPSFIVTFQHDDAQQPLMKHTLRPGG